MQTQFASQAFQSQIRGNNSISLGMMHMKIMSRTSTPHHKCTCKISLQLVEKCRSSSRHKIFQALLESKRGNNSVIFGMTRKKIMSRTSTPGYKCICKIMCQLMKKCRSSSRHKILPQTHRPTDRPTDRPTNRPTNRLTPIYPLSNFVCGGIIRDNNFLLESNEG